MLTLWEGLMAETAQGEIPVKAGQKVLKLEVSQIVNIPSTKSGDTVLREALQQNLNLYV